VILHRVTRGKLMTLVYLSERMYGENSCLLTFSAVFSVLSRIRGKG